MSKISFGILGVRSMLMRNNLSDFKELIDIIDQKEDQKELIEIRQMLKHFPKVKWRKAKLRWTIKLIKSLETTTKSRGGRQLHDLNMEEI